MTEKNNILIIDDNLDDLQIFGRYLTGAGYSVKLALGGQNGFEILSKEKIDCILLDWQMPQMPGIEVVEKIKSDPSLKFIPVIMLTGLEEEKNIITGLGAGADDYIGKSNTPQIILARIKAILRIKNLQDKLQQAISELEIANNAKTELLIKLDKAMIELKKLSIKDSLTDLYNYRYFQETLDIEISRAQRCKYNICCLMIDIDYYKIVNDDHGHLFGDFILKELGLCMKNCFRQADILVRYGGDEFVVLTMDTDYNIAFNIAERFRKYVEAHNFRDKEVLAKLTVSIGIASFFEDGVFDKEKFLSFADRSLYEAKLRGRNNTVTYKELLQDGCQGEKRLLETEDKLDGIAEFSKRSYIEAVKALIFAVEEKNIYTRQHSLNVLNNAFLIAEEMELPKNEVKAIENASVLHDLGKILISKEILFKNDKLTEEESQILKKHPSLTIHLLSRGGFIKKELPMILHHHEHYDGTGYPVGLKGKEIPLGARIIAVADAYENMCSMRLCRKMTSKEIINELIDKAGTYFDPGIVGIFLKALHKRGDLPSEIELDKQLQRLEKS